MPELPEVETVMRGLAPAVEGQRIVRVEQRRPDLRFPFPERFAARLEGRRLVHLRRRAKYILAAIEGGETLLAHLGMTGRFSVVMAGPAVGGGQLGAFTHPAGGDARHDHVVLTFANGVVVTYNDARRFGYMTLIPPAELEGHPLLAGLGVEPMGNALDADYLASRAAGRTADLKAFLMDQRIVAGLGNIYVCEALYRAGLKPTRVAACLAARAGRPTRHAEALVGAIRDVLGEAIAAGGSSLRDYQHTDGSLGYFQKSFAVYGRESEPCQRAGCEGVVRRIVQAGRSTFACPRCQR